jgi:hypothetical protein
MVARTVEIELPMPHAGQMTIRRESERFNVVACGRRWGKTNNGGSLAIETALEGYPVGWFAPTYKLLADGWDEAIRTLKPLGKRVTINKGERRIDLPTGGRIEFWSTEPHQAGDDESDVARGRKYKRIVYDEAAHARRLEADWTRAIRPTLSDLLGDAWFLSTPKGHNYFYRLWQRGQSGDKGWKSWQMPTSTNPYIATGEIDDAKRDLPADAFAQEYLAEFLADAANPFGIDAIRRCIGEMAEGPPAAWGVDLAKSVDWTVAHALTPQGDTCGFQRWQSDWRNTRARLGAMLRDVPSAVDSTGVGDPIVEDLQREHPNIEGYKFTKQSKQQLMEGLALAIQGGEITYPDGVLVSELEAFMYEYTPSGVRYAAPSGVHDDCVMALALAVYAWRNLAGGVSLRVASAEGDDMDARFFDRMNDEAMWE